MNDELVLRKRAIANWKRLGIVLAIIRLCKVSEVSKGNFRRRMLPIEQEKPPTWKQKLDKFMLGYIIMPGSRAAMTWSVTVGVIVFYSFIFDMYNLAYYGLPLQAYYFILYEYFLQVILVANIAMQFFMAKEVDQAEQQR